MTLDVFASRWFAIHHRGIIKAIGSLVTVIGTFAICSTLSREREAQEDYRRRPGTITIETWAGRIEIDGAQELIAPIIEQGQMMNKIEATENNKQWPEMSPNPEDYLR